MGLTGLTRGRASMGSPPPHRRPPHPPMTPTGPARPAPELDAFHRDGLVRLRGFHARARMGAIRERLLDELARLRVWNKGRPVGGPLNALPPFQQIAKLASMVKLDLHDALGTPELHRAIRELGGQAPQGDQGTQLLLSLPHQGRWSLDGLNWHIDTTARPDDGIPGVQAFYLIDEVVPHGGATLALARSHRLPGEAARALRAGLKSPTEAQAALLAADTEIVEMSGQAGDVFLMDMRVLHTPSINASKHIRMMATTRFLLPGQVRSGRGRLT